MASSYFTDLKAETETRLWINNPTMAEIKSSIAQGAVCCTTNPTYGANMLRRDREYALTVIDRYLDISDNDSVVADRVIQALVSRVIEEFRPLYDRSGGAEGYVTIQGNPFGDVDASHILEEARRYRELGPSFMAKIPVTTAGLAAIEALVAENTPVCATEVFAISQMIEVCELYKRVSASTGSKPAFFVTHITGIYDMYLLKELIEPLGIEITPLVLRQAGLAVARKQYRIFHDRGYDGYMLGGGARAPYHFTGLVGGDMHITVNWSTVEEILAQDPPVENTIAVETDPDVIDELCTKLPDFGRAWEEDGLSVEEFKDYGPVQRFRRQFINGWDALLADIACRREAK
jgi:transaldolase